MRLLTTTLPTKPLASTLAECFALDLAFVELNPIDLVELGFAEGRSIKLASSVRDTLLANFMTAHLFGHFVQLSEPGAYRDLTAIAEGPVPVRAPEEFWTDFRDYEVEAFALGYQLLMMAFGARLAASLRTDYERFLSLDLHRFFRYLRTGERTSVPEFIRLFEASERDWPHVVIPASMALPSMVASVPRIVLI
jgi:hypothetical protein